MVGVCNQILVWPSWHGHLSRVLLFSSMCVCLHYVVVLWTYRWLSHWCYISVTSMVSSYTKSCPSPKCKSLQKSPMLLKCPLSLKRVKMYRHWTEKYTEKFALGLNPSDIIVFQSRIFKRATQTYAILRLFSLYVVRSQYLNQKLPTKRPLNAWERKKTDKIFLSCYLMFNFSPKFEENLTWKVSSNARGKEIEERQMR